MSQTPHPHDPFAAQSDAPQQSEVPQQPEAPQQFEAPQAAAPQEPVAPQQPVTPQQPAPQSSAADHPHDPYAYEPTGAQTVPGPQSYAAPQSHPAPQGQSAPQGAPGQPVPPHTVPGGQMPLDQPPAQLKGVYDGPLTGEPASDSDTRMWAMFAQLSTIIGYVIGMGMLGWVGPLIIFLLYKDRSRFVRYNAAEALNAAIATFIAEVALFIVVSIIAVITFGFGSVLYFLVGVPALVHIIFAIVGAVKANQGEYWNYPVNIRLVK